MNLNLNDDERSRLGTANLNSFFNHLDLLIDNPEIIETIPNNSTVIFQGTKDSWLNEQNEKIARQAVEQGDNVYYVTLPEEFSFTFPDGRKVAFNTSHYWTIKEVVQVTKLTIEQIKRLERKKTLVSLPENQTGRKEKFFKFSQVIQLQAYKLIIESKSTARGFGENHLALKEKDLALLLGFYSERYLRVDRLEYFPVLFDGKIFPVASNMTGSQEFLSTIPSLDWKSQSVRVAMVYPPFFEVIKQLCENIWKLRESQVWTQEQLEERLTIAA